jgi:outer membrane protein assembly factor BamB
MLRRGCASILMACLAALAAALSAGAPPVAASAASAAVSEKPVFGPPTTTVTLQGTGFSGSEIVDVEFDGTVLARVTASSGTVTVKVKVPASARPGDHTWKLMGETSGVSASIIFLVRTDWAQLGVSSARTGYNPYENLLSPATIGTLNNLWAVSVSSSTRLHSSPVVYRDVAYVGDDDGMVRAFNVKTHATLWTSAFLGGAIYSTPAVAGTTVYVTTTDTNATGHGTLYALSTANGSQLWHHTASSPYGSSPAASGTYVVARSGSDLTTFSSGGTALWSNGDVSGPGPVISGGLVYVAGDGGTSAVNAYHLGSGTSAWSTSGADCAFLPTPVSGGILLSTGLCDSIAYALNASTGTLLWSRDVKTSTALENLTGVPAVSKGVAFFPLGSEIVACKLSSGALMWHVNTGTADGPEEGDAAVADGLLYVPDGRSLYWYQTSNGTRLGGLTGATTNSTISTVAVADARLVFEYTDAATFVALEAYTCTC